MQQFVHSCTKLHVLNSPQCAKVKDLDDGPVHFEIKPVITHTFEAFIDSMLDEREVILHPIVQDSVQHNTKVITTGTTYICSPPCSQAVKTEVHMKLIESFVTDCVEYS